MADPLTVEPTIAANVYQMCRPRGNPSAATIKNSLDWMTKVLEPRRWDAGSVFKVGRSLVVVSEMAT